METLRLAKIHFDSFIKKLCKEGQVIAPIKKGVVRFRPVTSATEICLDKQPFFPLKEYFFPQTQVLFAFKKTAKGTEFQVPLPRHPTRFFFGLRRCDLSAIKHQDMVFMEQTHDPYYIHERKNSVLIGYHCPTAPSPYCFCGSLNLADFYDLMLYDRGDHFLVEIGTQAGEQVIKAHASLFHKTDIVISKDEKKIPGSERLEVKDISKFYNHPGWKENVDRCLSCAACTSLCPTCYCFDIKDSVSTANPSSGERKRSWSSCQLLDFTRVAGDHVFREKREERFKHRIYHQLDYFKQKNKVNLCVGCGRCISGCPTRIDFVETLNTMERGTHGK